MSLAAKLQNIHNELDKALNDAKTKLIEKGVTVAENTTIKDLPTLVESIKQTGLDTSKITDFSYFCYSGYRLNVISEFDTSNGTNFNNMFSQCGHIVDWDFLEHIDTSNGTNFDNMFYDCSQLASIPKLDTSNGTSFMDMFRNCSQLASIPKLDVSHCQYVGSAQAMFYACKNLTSISLTAATTGFTMNSFFQCSALTNLTIDEGWSSDIYLTFSSKLTQESLHRMIENLADLTGATAKTFQVGETNLAKIDEEHIVMLEVKNWAYS